METDNNTRDYYKMRVYSDNAFSESITGLKKHTGDSPCIEAIEDMFREINDEYLTSIFIRENGKLLTDFCHFFKGIEEVPTKYWHPLFEHYENNIARDAYHRTKKLLTEHFDGRFEHDAIYLSLISHLDCAAHSIVNQLKRNLGMFERYNKLNK